MKIDVATPLRVFDADGLSGLFEGEPEAFAQFLSDVLQNVDACVLGIAEAAAQRDLARVRARAHELKGVAGNIGADELEVRSHAIEDAAKNGTPADVAEALVGFDQTRARCRTAIEAARDVATRA